MSKLPRIKFDEIGRWSEIKLEIIKRYAEEFSKILTAQEKVPFHHIYIDAFSGAGMHISKTTGELVDGSPVLALQVTPPFRGYHFIDLDGAKVAALSKIVGGRQDVNIYQGDCNRVLLTDIFPNVRWEDYRRGLCLLDPYGLHLNWEVIAKAGEMRSIEIFLNFPVADMNRNVLWNNPQNVSQADIERMNAFWGDDSWRKIAYTTERNLFEFEEKTDNETIANAFRQRLKDVAGFKCVPKPLAMRNSNNAIVYYLFFASQNSTGEKIASYIFNKYR